MFMDVFGLLILTSRNQLGEIGKNQFVIVWKYLLVKKWGRLQS